ncbi:MAG: signal peptidase II [Aquificae bacterium]|nr:signal peptidase II [Aquificota bacterium]
MDRKLALFLSVFFGVIALDLITKEIAEAYLSKVDRIKVIDGFFDLTLVWNKGAAFGILSQASETVRKAVLIFASLFIAIITTVYSIVNRKKLSNWEIVSLALISGGAFGNLYDRIFIGAVRDFLDFYIKDYHWPAFNIADTSITIGIASFVFYEIFLKNKNKKEG